MTEEQLEQASKLKHTIDQLRMAQRCLKEETRLFADEAWFGGVGSLYQLEEAARVEISEVLKKYENKYLKQLEEL